MTAPMQPQPYPGDLIRRDAGTVNYRREYRDVLGRPMTGTVTLTGTARLEQGDTVSLPAPVKVNLVGGVLEVDLPPDTYTLAASLRTVDGERASDSGTVTLAGDPEVDAERVERITVS